MFYIPKHFKIYELVDRETFSRYGTRAFQFFNPLALEMIDGIREYFGASVTVNDWFWGGKFQWRGLRTKWCEVGADYGMHRFAGAFDCDIQGLPAHEARKRILDDKDHPLLKNINCMENQVNWVHADVRNIESRILLVDP